jgi:hypothetical protein
MTTIVISGAAQKDAATIIVDLALKAGDEIATHYAAF